MTRRLLRLAWLVIASVQVSLPAAAAWGDSILARRAGAEPASHVEEHSTAQCARAHPADCILCRYLATSIDSRAAASPALCGTAKAYDLPAGTCLAPRAAARSVTLARGPPLS